MTSTIKVNTIQDSCGSALVAKCGSTITLGASGKTIALATGASQTGFGRTGSVNWCTTAKTSPFTSESGKGYFVNTTSGSVTVTLPASPSAGDIVAIADYAGTAGCNAIVIGRNSSKFQGTCSCGAVNEAREAVTLVYVDATQGWQSVGDSTESKINKAYVTATGGTITTCGDFKVHTFTSDGNFIVSDAGNSSGSNTVDYFVVAGGGAGQPFIGAGGGGGGFRLSNGYSLSGQSPLANPTGLSVPAATYPITIGGGGAAVSGPEATRGTSRQGANSVFSTITSAGGGGAGGFGTADPADPGVPRRHGARGGSGGGSDYNCGSGPTGCNAGGVGNIPPVSPPQGNPGGKGQYHPSLPDSGNNFGNGGGGGAGGAGGDFTSPKQMGVGGVGSFVSPSMAGSNGTTGPATGRYFSGGGGAGGGRPSHTIGPGGAGGGGAGSNAGNGTAGGTNTGGGGGGAGGYPSPGSGIGAAGGSGIVIIRYKYQN